MNFTLLREAFIVGLLVLIISIPVVYIQQKLLPGDTLSPYKYYISTVVIGVLGHLFIPKYL